MRCPFMYLCLYVVQSYCMHMYIQYNCTYIHTHTQTHTHTLTHAHTHSLSLSLSLRFVWFSSFPQLLKRGARRSAPRRSRWPQAWLREIPEKVCSLSWWVWTGPGAVLGCINIRGLAQREKKRIPLGIQFNFFCPLYCACKFFLNALPK